MNEVRGQDDSPGGGVELKREDDVVSVAYLTNEAALGAQVAVGHVGGGVLRLRHQVVCVFALCDLQNKTKQTHIRMFQRGR